MNIDLIKELMKAFSEAQIHELKVESDGLKISMKKDAHPTLTNHVEKQIETPSGPEKTAGLPVKAPLVGIYYAQSAPDAKPFVSVGQTIEKGQTLCIIEAMKVMNEIKAPYSGVIQDICVEDGQLVEFDQILMHISE